MVQRRFLGLRRNSAYLHHGFPNARYLCFKHRWKAQKKKDSKTDRAAGSRRRCCDDIERSQHSLRRTTNRCAQHFVQYFVLIMACIFYAPLIPLALPIACIGSLLTYMSYKYMLLRVHKMPEMFGDLMATFFASLMPAILVVWALSYLIFVR